ncbi:hypothetical protein BBJ28_00020664, partial [Nothophytophthora sp. Chile5]
MIRDRKCGQMALALVSGAETPRLPPQQPTAKFQSKMVNVLRTTSVLAAMAAATAVTDAFKCTGINYNIRAGPDWATADVKCKPASQIATELATLKTVTDTIRLYSL